MSPTFKRPRRDAGYTEPKVIVGQDSRPCHPSRTIPCALEVGTCVPNTEELSLVHWAHSVIQAW